MASPAFVATASHRILYLLMLSFLLTGCAIRQHHRSGSAASDAQPSQVSPEALPLFVHLISPRYYTDPPIPPKRIVTMRIVLGEDFAVSFGDSSFSSGYSVGGTRPYSYSGDAVLAGRIKRQSDKFFAHLLGRSHTSMNHFHGEIELERIVESQGGSFSGGIWSVRFVLSTNSDCRVFLKD